MNLNDLLAWAPTLLVIGGGLWQAYKHFINRRQDKAATAADTANKISQGAGQLIEAWSKLAGELQEERGGLLARISILETRENQRDQQLTNLRNHYDQRIEKLKQLISQRDDLIEQLRETIRQLKERITFLERGKDDTRNN